LDFLRSGALLAGELFVCLFKASFVPSATLSGVQAPWLFLFLDPDVIDHLHEVIIVVESVGVAVDDDWVVLSVVQ